jgi:hypothetical protein
MQQQNSRLMTKVSSQHLNMHISTEERNAEPSNEGSSDGAGLGGYVDTQSVGVGIGGGR